MEHRQVIRHEGIGQRQGSVRIGERSSFGDGWLVGAAAGLIASGVLIWTAGQWGGSSLPQLLSERVTADLPLGIISETIQRFGSNAKPLALLSITADQIFVAGIIGGLYARWARPAVTRRLLGGLILFVASWLLLTVVIAPLGGIGPFALDSAQGTGATLASFTAAAAVFALIMALLVPWPTLNQAPDSGRRELLRTGSLIALAVPGLLALNSIFSQANKLRGAFSPEKGVRDEAGDGPFELAGMPQFYTPNDAFYVVSKNLIDPSVSEGDWSLEFGGMVEQPLTLSYSDILTRPSTEFPSTLECISNQVGGDLISNTTWTGFPLRDLLDEVGLQPGVIDLQLEAADGYVESIPLEEALSPDTMLVYLMDGVPLPDKHGYPLRLIVPGIFGMKNVKWITAIKPVGEDIQGFWQHRGWSDIARVKTMSRLDIPHRGYKAKLGEVVPIGGIAFAGDRGISKVEVSLDGGETWQEARLSDVPSSLTWRLWRLDYLADEPGIKKTVVRATDGTGQLQSSERAEILPDGASGYDKDWFEVLDEQGQSTVPPGDLAHYIGQRWVDSGRG